MRRWMIVGAAVALAACAAGTADEAASDRAPKTDDSPSLAMPDESGFESPAGGTADAGGKDSGVKDTGGSSSTSSSSSGGSTSSSGGSTSSSSGGSTSSSGGSSGTTAGGACGVCDRDWTCNGITDSWLTESARCVNQRTTTALRCDGKFDQGTSYNVGTWSGGPTKITLVYPMLGGGTKSYDCYP